MTTPWTHLITTDQILHYHAEGIARHGAGTVDPPRPNCIEEALGNAWQAEQYEENPAKLTGWIFATHIYIYLERKQCFTNGNKRAAWASMIHVLDRLRLTIDCTDEDARDACISLATGEMSAQIFLRWLQSSLRDLDDN